jgi:hypothetical protein
LAFDHDIETASVLIETAISLRPIDSTSQRENVGAALIAAANTVLQTVHAHSGSSSSTHTQSSRYHHMLRALLVPSDEEALAGAAVAVNPHPRGTNSRATESKSAFKLLRERISDMGTVKGTGKLQSKRQRVKVLKSLDLIGDEALAEGLRERAATDSSLSTAARSDTVLLRVSRIEVKNVKSMYLFSGPRPYVYVKAGNDKIHQVKTPVCYNAPAGYVFCYTMFLLVPFLVRDGLFVFLLSFYFCCPLAFSDTT